jgi:SPP1 gp7 family putative phage head morphogenesis protein
MEPAESWGRLASALIGPYEREIVGALVGAYQSLEHRIEVAYKRALDDGSTFPLQRLLLLRDELGRELNGLALPPELQQTITRGLADGQLAADYWAMAELNRVQQQAQRQGIQQAAQLFADAASNPEAILSPAMAQQNPSALIAAAQRSNALRNYAAGSKGSQAFAQLNRLAEADLRGRIIGAVEFHLAQSDSWRQLKRTLSNSLAITSTRAQALARTEMAAAMVEGTKLRYEAEGIQQVQWQAVGSSRTCSFCAPRHRRVYRLGEVVCPAHPNCRCALTPWDPEWVDLGLVDRQEEAKDRAAVMDELREAGKEPNYGPSPFERALGRQEAAEAVWMPPRYRQ